MRTLALDLGTHTGYAHTSGMGIVQGTKLLATDTELKKAKKVRLDRRCDIRVVAFWEWLTAMQSEYKFESVVFEDVEFQTYRMATQLWSSLRAVVWLAFPGAIIEAVPVTTLKKFATGSGTADKAMMKAALVRRAPNLFPLDGSLDDNAIDATWIYLWAQQNLSRKKQP